MCCFPMTLPKKQADSNPFSSRSVACLIILLTVIVAESLSTNDNQLSKKLRIEKIGPIYYVNSNNFHFNPFTG